MGLTGVSPFGGVFAGKKVLVTGDTGFKGSWLALWLNELGAEVYGFSLPPRSASDNYVTSALDKKVRHTDGDIRNREALTRSIHKIQPDVIFHLAAQSLVLDSYREPQGTFETNVMGTVNLFEAARTAGSVRALVNVTSDKCYQNNNWIWGYRENDPMGGSDPYSASKGCAELVANAYQKSFFEQHPCNLASARAGNVIGGGDWAPNRIVADFFRAVKEQKALRLRNPDSVRPWQFVLEPLSGYLMLCSKLLTGGKKFCGGWNFGPAEVSQHTVLELVEEMIRLSGKGSYSIEREGKEAPEAHLLNLDVSKAVNFLRWSPVLSFSEAVERTVEGYQAGFKTASTYDSRVAQINDYVRKAAGSKVEWAGT
ncbi:MAG TPA: CDP-glucose 4,6-dehydratase [Bacteroidota bacterium]